MSDLIENKPALQGCRNPDMRTLAAPISLMEDILYKGIGLRIRCTGQSMYPQICSGDTVIIEWADSSVLRAGDIILYKDRFGHPVIHRVVRLCDGDFLITKGDANKTLDEPVLNDRIIGRVVSRETSSSLSYKGSTNIVSDIIQNYLMAVKNLSSYLLYLCSASISGIFRRILRKKSQPVLVS